MSAEEIEMLIRDIAEEEGVRLYLALRKKKDFSEFKLAEKIDADINKTRNLLYKLHNFNLASFIKKKDRKKGWYIYYWTFNKEEAKRLSEKLRKNKSELLKMELSQEREKSFFMCKNKCGRIEFEEAFDNNYKCPECGEMLEYEDNANNLRRMRDELTALS